MTRAVATLPRPDPDQRVRDLFAELAETLIEMARSARDDSLARSAPTELISIATFAQRIGIAKSTAYLAVRDGSVRTIRLRGRRLVPAIEVDRLRSTTPIATHTNTRRGAVQGQPTRFLVGHYQRQPLDARFRAHVAMSDGCWEWTGRIDAKGYGRFKVRHQPRYAHRVAWELANGPLAPNVQVRHLCGNHRCVRIEHLIVPRLHAEST